MENSIFNTCFARITFEDDICNNVKKIVKQVCNPVCDYIDDTFIEFVFNKTTKIEYYGDFILPIHYLFLNMTPELLKRITKLKLNFKLVSQNNKHILNFLFHSAKKVILNDLIEFLDYNNLSFFEMNEESSFLVPLFSSLMFTKATIEEQHEWYDYVFNNHIELLTKPEKVTSKLPMHTIIFGLNIELTKKIVSQINDINVSGPGKNTILHYICAKENNLCIHDIEKIHYLIDNGANINLKNGINKTPFELLCTNGIKPKYIIEFLKKGADPNIIVSDDNNVAFVALRMFGTTVDELREIITLGVDYKYKNKNGHTILSLVTYLNFLPHIKYLFELGLDINNKPKDNQGLTPLHYVFMQCSEETIEYVLDNINNLMGYSYYTNNGFKIKYPYEFLCYNKKLSDPVKIKIYKKVFEYIKETEYRNRPSMWLIDSSMYYKIPKKLTVELKKYSDESELYNNI